MSEPSTLDLFPLDLLPQATSALMLYCPQDETPVGRVANVTLVEPDPDRCTTLRRLYPEWNIEEDNVYQWVARHDNAQADIVVADPPNQETRHCLGLLPQLATLARQAVILGTVDSLVAVDLLGINCLRQRPATIDEIGPPTVPPGWTLTRITPRGTLQRWLLMEPTP